MQKRGIRLTNTRIGQGHTLQAVRLLVHEIGLRVGARHARHADQLDEVRDERVLVDRVEHAPLRVVEVCEGSAREGADQRVSFRAPPT